RRSGHGARRSGRGHVGFATGVGAGRKTQARQKGSDPVVTAARRAERGRRAGPDVRAAASRRDRGVFSTRDGRVSERAVAGGFRMGRSVFKARGQAGGKSQNILPSSIPSPAPPNL